MNKSVIGYAFMIMLTPHFLMSLSKSDCSISSLDTVMLGNTQQWIYVNGSDINNPVLLFLHGGPGFPSMPYSHFDSELLSEHFIVVHWDQLGAGKSYNQQINPLDMSVERFRANTHELIQILKHRFNKEKVFLIGYSWGSCLGLYSVIDHPEDIHAYIGMGQTVDLLQGEIDGYNFTLQKAVELDDSVAFRTLEEIGIPPFRGGMESLIEHRKLLGKFGGAFKSISYPEIEQIRKSSPIYTEHDQGNYFQGYGFSYHHLWNQVMKINFFNEKTDLDVPVYFFEGRYDYGTPYALVEKYFEIITAPHKEIIWFENSGHFINLEETERYQAQLVRIAEKTLVDK